MKVKVGFVPPAPATALPQQEKVGEASVQVKVSDPAVSELPVRV
jgi:hypothetical protein